MHHNATSTSSEQLHDNGAFATTTTKKKRRPAGTPDPEAEVVSLSPKTLLESDRYVCEICNQGFQRDQNLQMHRRRHKVPWQLLKRSETTTDQLGLGGGNSKTTTKKVYVCPEPSCLHHDPRHALGDLVGIKKHFRRKHSTHKQWVCDKCSKAYAVQSDYKAHLKTCGTRGHSCDCGRVFSRVESFIEHQDVCTVRKFSQLDDHDQDQDQQLAGPVKRSVNNSSRTESSSSASTEPKPQLLPPPDPIMALMVKNQDELISSQQNLLDLSIGLGLGGGGGREMIMGNENYSTTSATTSALGLGSGSGEEAGILREYANEQLRVAAAEKAYAEEARQQARRQVEVAELEFANAQRMRLQAHAELERAHLLKQHALTKINSTLTQITCPTCKLHFTYHHPPPPTTTFPPSTDESSSLAISYMSSPTTDGDGE